MAFWAQSIEISIVFCGWPEKGNDQWLFNGNRFAMVIYNSRWSILPSLLCRYRYIIYFDAWLSLLCNAPLWSLQARIQCLQAIDSERICGFRKCKTSQIHTYYVNLRSFKTHKSALRLQNMVYFSFKSSLARKPQESLLITLHVIFKSSVARIFVHAMQRTTKFSMSVS